MVPELPGPEKEALGRKAGELNTYLAGNAYMVREEDFPDR